ncbi:unnamed protein product [Rotaria sordida]|uniref:ADP ribosyltransferase domain-containing protein n=1 Tax=Rotaria sordida TaxID=392033 RepID=A0A815R7C3_9BILA|nr:unnamed protein product [Rotaria sordida]CAF4032942.1 unnamed protein product [Rotaria sordida]
MDLFNYFDQNQTSTHNITEQQADFLWAQLFNEMIHHLPHDQKAKQEMIDTCRDYYRGNRTVLAKIDEFERTYHIDNSIRWYTKDTFIYKLINKALRTKDVEQLYVFRYYITDLSTSLNREYKNSHLTETIFLYRGATMSHDEFEKLKANKNHFISINGYFSTSRSRSVATIYVGSNTSTTNGVLFEIECDAKMNVIFADISHYSEIPDEEEVLFDLGAAFQIISVTQDNQQCPPVWIEIEDESSPILFGVLLNKMGLYEKCIRYFQNLLKDSPENTNIARIHFHLADAYDNKDDYDAALEHFETAHEMVRNRTDDVGLKELAYVWLYKGIVLNHKEDFTKSLEYSKKALKSFEKYYSPSSNHRDIASCLFTMGQSYFGLSEFGLYEGAPTPCLLAESLHCQERALNMQYACLPVDHFDIALTLAEISKIRYFMKDTDEAIEYGQKSLTILRQCLPADHLETAALSRYMATYYYEKGDLNLALDYFHQCLIIQRKCLPLDHVEIARTERNIARVLGDMGETEEALKYLREAGLINNLFVLYVALITRYLSTSWGIDPSITNNILCKLRTFLTYTSLSLVLWFIDILFFLTFLFLSFHVLFQ